MQTQPLQQCTSREFARCNLTLATDDKLTQTTGGVAQHLDLVNTIWLALLQGITEFLPISSSAHLILPAKLLGIKDQGLTFDVAVHAGSLAAVIYYFRDQLKDLIKGCLTSLRSGRLNAEGALSLKLIIASLPVLPVGILAQDLIEQNLRTVAVIGTTTLVFGLLLAWADRKSNTHDEQQLTIVGALFIGIAQTLALIPGVSRSGITLSAALLLGLNREAAARIAFLLGIPAIAGASLVKLTGLVMSGAPAQIASAGLGFLVSAVAAFLSIGLFLRFLNRIGLLPFAIYRVILGTLLLTFFL